MTPEKLKAIISQGEGTEVELKESKDSLARKIYESICAFLNRRGGHVVLGVDNDRNVVGINPSKVQEQLDQLAKDMNNPQLFKPTFDGNYMICNTANEMPYHPIGHLDGAGISGNMVPASVYDDHSKWVLVKADTTGLAEMIAKIEMQAKCDTLADSLLNPRLKSLMLKDPTDKLLTSTDQLSSNCIWPPWRIRPARNPRSRPGRLPQNRPRTRRRLPSPRRTPEMSLRKLPIP